MQFEVERHLLLVHNHCRAP